MKNRLRILVLGLVLVSCDLGIYEGRSLQDGSDTALARRSAYISNTISEMVFDADISLLYKYGGDYDNTYLTQDAFSFIGEGYSILDFKTPAVDVTGKSSTIVIVDQAGSYGEVDPENRRSKSLDKYFYDVKAPSDFILGASAKGGMVSPEPLEYFQPDFSTEAEVQVPYLFGLPKRTGGNSAILDAMSQAIDRLSSVSGTRNIVALVHGPDQSSTITADALVAKAVAAQVHVSVVMLAKADAGGSMAKVSLATQGLFSVCPTENEMITTFNHLYRLLNGVSDVYRVRIKYAPPSGGLVPGVETLHTLQVRYGADNYDYNPVLLYVKIP